jgi:hypothetical protein
MGVPVASGVGAFASGKVTIGGWSGVVLWKSRRRGGLIELLGCLVLGQCHPDTEDNRGGSHQNGLFSPGMFPRPCSLEKTPPAIGRSLTAAAMLPPILFGADG